MSKKLIVFLLVIMIIFSGLFLVAKTLKAQEENPTEVSGISAQLQQVIQNQQVIISKLNEMKEELKIIKIRTTAKR